MTINNKAMRNIDRAKKLKEMENKITDIKALEKFTLLEKLCSCYHWAITGFSTISSTAGENWCSRCGRRRW